MKRQIKDLVCSPHSHAWLEENEALKRVISDVLHGLYESEVRA
jgi:hypothetical protein